MRQLLAILALVLLLTACAGPPAAVAPTATATAAPTATTAPTTTTVPTARPTATTTPSPAPTATPRPSATARATATVAATVTATVAATGAPPTAAATQAGAAGPEVADALRRTAAVQTYSAEIDLNGGGFAGATPGEPAELLGLTGRFDGAEHEFTATGFLAAFLGADPGAGLQAVRADGVSYIRGPMALIGATEPAWYRLPPERAALAEPPVSPALLSRALSEVRLDARALTAGQSQQRGGQTCTPYTGGTATTVTLLRGFYQGGLPPLVAPEQVQQGNTTLLVCDDGFLHRLTMSLSGAFPGSTPAPFSLDLDARLADFDSAITIAAPQGARDLPVPPSPTP